MVMIRKKQTTVHLLPEFEKKLKEEAKKNGTSKAGLGGKIIEDYLSGNKEEAVLNDIVFYLERLLYFSHMNFEILKNTNKIDIKKTHMATLEAVKLFKKTIAGLKESQD